MISLPRYSFFLILASGFLLELMAPAAARAAPRTWTNSQGSRINGELVSVGEGKASIKVGTRIYLVPMESLTQRDQEFIQNWMASKREQEKAAQRVADSPIIKALDGNLVKLDKKRVKRFELESPEKLEYIAFYTSASWCGPCHAFTPVLAKKYKSLKRKYSNFELVLLSADYNEEDWEEYVKEYKMPWPALKFKASREKQMLRSGNKSRGIPCIHIVKIDGTVVDDAEDGASASLRHLDHLLEESRQ